MQSHVGGLFIIDEQKGKLEEKTASKKKQQLETSFYAI